MRILLVILRKEFTQFFHNSFLPKLCLIFPLMVMLVMPLVTNMEVRHVGVVVVDNDHQSFSRRITSNLKASDYLSLVGEASTYSEALRFVCEGDADVILEIPYGFNASLSTPIPKTLNLSANSVNATKGSIGMQYLLQVLSEGIAQELPQKRDSLIKTNTLYLFNPTQNYRYFMIPALMIMLLVMLCGFLPALNLVVEKETGTIEQINVSPVKPLIFVLGKVIPYWIIGFVVITIAIIVARLVYDLSPQGSLFNIYLASFLFIIVMTSLGAIIANKSYSMQQVMFVMFFFVLTFILLSGLITPVTSMPIWAQNITYVIPPRYYIEIMRGTYLRGASIPDQSFQFSMLALLSIAMTAVAILTYKKRS